MDEKKIRLTSSEIASIWTTYMNNSLSTCILRFMLKHIQDAEIKHVIQFSYDIANSRLKQISTILNEEQSSIPAGFTEHDVNMDAPWLFTDAFCLTYVNHMARIGMVTYSGFVGMSFRKDICEFFSESLTKTNQLYKESLDIAVSKGVNARAPYIVVPKEIDFIDSKKYMSGFSLSNNKRPLNAIEISYLYMNIMTNAMGVKLCLAFAQTSSSKEVQSFMLRATEISKKHIKIFVDNLLKDEIEAPQVPDHAVSNSTTKTFSDKLMMFHMSLIIAAGTGNYATAGAASQRSDLAVNYERLSLEVARLAKSGVDIMIKNKWLEQPPGIKDREKLAKKKEKS